MITTIITEDTTKTILNGAKKLYEAVSTTMGPRGSNVIFRKHGKKVAVTHDGVTVAKAVTLGEGAEDVGADLLKEAAMKLDSTTGDGTTTVTVLAYHMLKEALKEIESGKNPMKLKVALDKDQIQILDAIKSATKEAGAEEIIQVAQVASGDKEIGQEVGELVSKVGKDTPIFLEMSESTETTTEVINGFKIYSGSASPYLLDESGIRHEAREVNIIAVDAKLRDKDDVMPILKLIGSLDPTNRKVLLVANEIAGDALSLLLVNTAKGLADISVVKTPQNIKNSTDYLTDLAISTGGILLSRNGSHPLDKISPAHMGYAKRVIVELTETTIIEGVADQEFLATHRANLEKLVDTATNQDVKQFAEQRLNTLGQKIAIVRVGGQSESEIEEKNFRYEDAIGAAKSALKSGFLPGGGTFFYELSHKIKNPILKAALKAPIKKIYENAGIELNDYMNDIRSGYGVDVMNPDRGVVDLVKEGIIDPSESEEQCIRTAVAISGLLMTSGAIIVDEIRENKNAFELEASSN
jgi:chaperonin GroEL